MGDRGRNAKERIGYGNRLEGRVVRMHIEKGKKREERGAHLVGRRHEDCLVRR